MATVRDYYLQVLKMTNKKKAKLLKRKKSKIKKLNTQRNTPVNTKELKKKEKIFKNFKPDRSLLKQ